MSSPPRQCPCGSTSIAFLSCGATIRIVRASANGAHGRQRSSGTLDPTMRTARGAVPTIRSTVWFPARTIADCRPHSLHVSYEVPALHYVRGRRRSESDAISAASATKPPPHLCLKSQKVRLISQPILTSCPGLSIALRPSSNQSVNFVAHPKSLRALPPSRQQSTNS